MGFGVHRVGATRSKLYHKLIVMICLDFNSYHQQRNADWSVQACTWHYFENTGFAYAPIRLQWTCTPQ